MRSWKGCVVGVVALLAGVGALPASAIAAKKAPVVLAHLTFWSAKASNCGRGGFSHTSFPATTA